MDILRGLFHSVMFIMGAIIRTDCVKYPKLLVLCTWFVHLIYIISGIIFR